MPDYDVIIDGKQKKIELARKTAASFTTKVDSKPREVRLKSDESTLGKTFELEIDGKTYKVELPKTKQTRNITVKVEDATFEVGVKTAFRGQTMTVFEPTAQDAVKKGRAGTTRKVAAEGAVVAPMTGKVVKIKVKKGDHVKAGQVLCVVEAMKMENEISSSTAGTVREVNITEGMPVGEGDTLFLIA